MKRRLIGTVALARTPAQHSSFVARKRCGSKRTGEFLGSVHAIEAYGLSRVGDGRLYASLRDGTAFAIGKTRLRSQFLEVVSAKPIRRDDHWVAVA